MLAPVALFRSVNNLQRLPSALGNGFYPVSSAVMSLTPLPKNASSLATEVGGNLQRFYAKPR